MSLILTLGSVERTYGGSGGVRAVDLEVGPGEVVGLVGPNGSGKTTLARVISTLTAPTAGRVAWFGLTDRRSPAVRRRLGVVTDQPAHFEDLTGRQNARFFAAAYGGHEVAPVLERFGLADAADRPVREYSLGMRRRLALAEALLHDPHLLVLDEPSLGLDHQGDLELAAELERLREAKRAVVLATNDVALAERSCTRILFLHEGRPIRSGTPAELLTELAETQEFELTLAAALDPAPIAALPSVRGVAAGRGRLRIVASRALSPAQLLAALDGSSGLVTGMTVRRADLGDLFLALTGAALDA